MTQSSDTGSVKVAVRLRPLNKNELASSSSKSNKGLRAWRVHENRGIDGKVTQRSIRQTGEEKAIEGKSLFSFDEIFDKDAATDDILCHCQGSDGKSLQRRKDLDHSLFRHDSMAGGGASMSIMPFCHLEE
mmetsp:Transcript_31396/g.47691  ORF Transcript_31396/g.47691 Transcript_31396/m.47691 type:complete len:131 (+) Transcript_31396:97-489(+)